MDVIFPFFIGLIHRWVPTRCPYFWWNRPVVPAGLKVRNLVSSPYIRPALPSYNLPTVSSSQLATPVPWRWTEERVTLGHSWLANIGRSWTPNEGAKQAAVIRHSDGKGLPAEVANDFFGAGTAEIGPKQTTEASSQHHSSMRKLGFFLCIYSNSGQITDHRGFLYWRQSQLCCYGAWGVQVQCCCKVNTSYFWEMTVLIHS